MANNFMAIAERFGKMSNNQDSQSIANLGTTQMITMLALQQLLNLCDNTVFHTLPH